MNILIKGKPGCGKTTLMKGLLPYIKNASGFITEEMREGGVRVGFSIKTLDGWKGTLAHVNVDSRLRVGRYGVNMNDLNEACRHIGNGPVVIDEIGKMELFSPLFRENVLKTLEERRLVATIMEASNPFCDEIKSREDVSIHTLTEKNRDEMSLKLKEMLSFF